MTGMTQIRTIRSFEEKCDRMGFRIDSTKYFEEKYGDTISLFSAAPNFPIYNPDCALFVGTVEQASQWLDGVEWGQNYYKMLGATTSKQVSRKEQDRRNEKLVKILTDIEDLK